MDREYVLKLSDLAVARCVNKRLPDSARLVNRRPGELSVFPKFTSGIRGGV
jgi:hypothetical protein